MRENLSFILSARRREDTKFLYIKYYVVSLYLRVFVFTKNNKLFYYLIAKIEGKVCPREGYISQHEAKKSQYAYKRYECYY